MDNNDQKHIEELKAELSTIEDKVMADEANAPADLMERRRDIENELDELGEDY